jgi:hypothetical protein
LLQKSVKKFTDNLRRGKYHAGTLRKGENIMPPIRTTERRFPGLDEIIQLIADLRSYAAERRQERIERALSAAVF